MKNRIKDYFTFTKSERIGLFILLSILGIVLILPGFFKNAEKSSPVDDDLYKVEVEKFLNSEQHRNNQLQKSETYSDDSEYTVNATRNRYTKFKPNVFDPNTCSLDDWVRMGFSEKQASTIINYRNKGGSFRVKEDFKKLYVVDDETYKIFAPYIDITPTDSKNQPYTTTSYGDTRLKEDWNAYNGTSTSPVMVELNSADSLELISIKGIGPVFASRILKLRSKLGGFTRAEQLMEVFGIDSTRYPEISKQVSVDAGKISTINVNCATINDLKKHPYIDYYMAKAIVDRRIQKGRINSIEELRDILKKKPGLFEKISPYLVTLP